VAWPGAGRQGRIDPRWATLLRLGRDTSQRRGQRTPIAARGSGVGSRNLSTSFALARIAPIHPNGWAATARLSRRRSPARVPRWCRPCPRSSRSTTTGAAPLLLVGRRGPPCSVPSSVTTSPPLVAVNGLGRPHGVARPEPLARVARRPRPGEASSANLDSPIDDARITLSRTSARTRSKGSSGLSAAIFVSPALEIEQVRSGPRGRSSATCIRPCSSRPRLAGIAHSCPGSTP
jgi:hypothetical protein